MNNILQKEPKKTIKYDLNKELKLSQNWAWLGK